MRQILGNKIVIAILLLWTFINVILLSISEADSYKSELWPFTSRSSVDTYDFTEFLLYVLGPVVIVIVVSLLKEEEHEEKF